MEFQHTEFKNLIICNPALFKDERGYFFESFNASLFKEKTGLYPDFIQDNQSMSVYGVIRGLHLQRGTHAQTKLVRCIQGKVLDVVVDLRKNQPTFGKHFAIELSAENQLQLYIPKGFAHGFSVLSKEAIFIYKCDRYYHKESELSVAYNDPHFAIDWKVPVEKQLLSEKDKNNLYFEEAVKYLDTQ
ncbi:MAG: dTDP-4-dehydrorhamnose 3,5-epimerase [Bacteroidetes bacterium HGW-Bacteroidetes-2]|jgi:dTDP-4-dehydrorhamnose 3,5-epimerase|nr:MAG: dTDP-4-dehydrorhamnose 3,5-epimerase [Bacteroidetes bacterium HGW-Bacteroidetes-2]